MSAVREVEGASTSATVHEGAVMLELMGRWRMILAVGAAFAIFAAALSFLLVPKYESGATLAVVETSGVSPGVSAVMEQVGGLASMIGIGAASSATDIVVARLRSREFGLGVVKALQLERVLFPADWDAKAGRWKDAGQRPTDEQLFRVFDSSVRSVRVDSKTGLVRVSVRLADRILAARLVNEMVSRCNAMAQAEEVREAENRIALLMREAESTQLVSLRNELYSVINMEIHRVAVLKSRRDFALRVLDPAFPADEDSPASPNRFLIGALGLLCGLFGAAAIVAAHQIFRRASPK